MVCDSGLAPNKTLFFLSIVEHRIKIKSATKIHPLARACALVERAERRGSGCLDWTKRNDFLIRLVRE